jgi:hypothetical protein
MPRERHPAGDPWLASRMRREAAVADAYHQVYPAVVDAMTEFLAKARAAVLHQQGSTGITADAGAGPPPDLSMWPDDTVWLSLVDHRVAPVVSRVFGDNFRDLAARADIADEPYRIAYLESVSDRLSPRLWPRGVFEEVRYELLEGVADGETITQLRDRVAATLAIDAPTRQVRARINELTRLIDNPQAHDLDPTDVAEFRAERRDLYEAARESEGIWREKARRIARTETMGALNGGTFQGAVAYSQAAGETMHKQWWATSDSRVRPDHWAAHGQTRPLDQPFDVGGWPMQHPGEAGAPAGEVVNCRCTLLILTPEEAAAQADLFPEANAVSAAGSIPEVDPVTVPTTTPAPPAAPASTVPELPTGWRGPIAPLDTISGDDRMIATPADGQLQTRPLPQSLLYQPALDDAHGGAYTVGLITKAWIQDGMLWGEGPFDLSDPAAAEVAGRVARGVAGWVSVALDNTTYELQCFQDGKPVDCDEALGAVEDEGMIFFEPPEGLQMVDVATDWRLMTVTLVAEPAFAEAKIEPVYDFVYDWTANGDATDGTGSAAQPAATPPAPAPTSNHSGTVDGGPYGAIGDTSLGWAPRDTAWNAQDAAGRVADWATGDGDSIDPAKYSRAFLWQDPDLDDTDPAAYLLGFADIVGGDLKAVLTGVQAAGDAVNGDGAGGVPDADVDAVKATLETLYELAAEGFQDPSIVPPWKTGDGGTPPADGGGAASSTASATSGKTRANAVALAAAGGPPLPPASWFADPDLIGPTPLTVTDDGRLFGHLATWGTCHVGIAGKCVTPPRSTCDYSLFHVGVQRTAEGGDVAVGTIVLGTTHADLTAGLVDTMTHYAHTGSAVAAVAAGEDSHGIWVAGALLPGVTDEQVATLRRAPLSGDWRNVGGSLELVAALAVNVPGFPIGRERVGDGGRRLSVVAVGALPRPSLDRAARLDRIARQVARHTVQILDQRDKRRTTADAYAARVRRVRAGKATRRVAANRRKGT